MPNDTGHNRLLFILGILVNKPITRVRVDNGQQSISPPTYSPISRIDCGPPQAYQLSYTRLQLQQTTAFSKDLHQNHFDDMKDSIDSLVIYGDTS